MSVRTIYPVLSKFKSVWLCRNQLSVFQKATNKRELGTVMGPLQNIFNGKEDLHKGVTIDSNKENCEIQAFPKKLEESLEKWKLTNKRGIWFKVDLKHADWIPILSKNGFNFHHAIPGYVMMYKWLPSTPCTIPAYAHTMVGVGAIVLNDKNQILSVKQKGLYPDNWKFPGGIIEPGENIVDGAVREVKEETNIDVEFRSLVSLTHALKGMMRNCSDIYIVIACQALSNDINMCTRELSDCVWIDLDEFLKHDNVLNFHRNMILKYLEYKKNGVSIDVQSDIHKQSKRPYQSYSIGFKSNL